MPDAKNPWHSLYQNTGLDPSFGAGRRMPEGHINVEAEPEGRPDPPSNIFNPDLPGSAGSKRGVCTPMSVQMQERGMDDTRAAGSVFEYLTARSPRNGLHTRFSGVCGCGCVCARACARV